MSNAAVRHLASSQKDLKDELSDFKRQRIKEEACQLFYVSGYEATTIDAIAQRLNVTKPFIYSYYRNKSELLFDICKTGIGLSLEAIDRAEQAELTPGERLKFLVERVMRIIIDYQEYIVVYVREEKNIEPDLAREVREQRKLFDHRLAAILEEGHRTGEFNVLDPLLSATTIGGIMTWVSFWYSPTGKRLEAEIITHVLGMVDAVVHVHSNQTDCSKEIKS